MIELKNVRAGYGREEILHGISLSVREGEITTLIGGNGSGKSTLLKAICGFIPLSGGDVEVDGVSVKTLSRTELARKIAYLPQGKNVPDISAGRMVLHGRFPYLSYPRKYRKEDFEIAERSMEEMGVRELAERQMSELSGGMRQKVYIAMALAQQAPVIVMDEPTTYLDMGQQMKFVRMARNLSAKGKTIILVLHDIPLALKISRRIAVIKDGKVIKCASGEEILESGVIGRLYGVDVKSVQTDAGCQYYYEIEQGEE